MKKGRDVGHLRDIFELVRRVQALKKPSTLANLGDWAMCRTGGEGSSDISWRSIDGRKRHYRAHLYEKELKLHLAKWMNMNLSELHRDVERLHRDMERRAKRAKTPVLSPSVILKVMCSAMCSTIRDFQQ